MNKPDSENRKRHVITMASSIVFIISAVLVFFTSFSLLMVADIRSEAEYLEHGEYQRIYYNGELYEQGHYFFQDEDEMRYAMEQNGYPDPENFVLKTYSLKNDFDRTVLDGLSGTIWLIDIISAVLLPITFILAITHTGKKPEGGGIALNSFDKIFSELQLAAAILISMLVYPAAILYGSWAGRSAPYQNIVSQVFKGLDEDFLANDLTYYIDPFHGNYGEAYIFEPGWVQLVISLILVFTVVIIDLAVILSIARKLKNRSFFRSTIPGYLAYRIMNLASDSPYLTLKILGPPIGAIVVSFAAASLFIAGLGYAAIPGILLISVILIAIILLTLPRSLRRYKMVKNGIDELQQGNFDYKIPDMGSGELAALAHSVNAISDAQNLAIQNELKSQRLRTDLISNVSHDLRTPLTSMVSYVDLLKNDGLDSPHAGEYLDIIVEKTKRLQKLTEDLFEAAKASSGDIPVNLERIEMNSMTAQALAELEENLEKNEIQVILNKPEEDTFVLADGKLLWRVIENLLINVSKYALRGSRAYVDILPSEDVVTLEVKNMSREQLNISSDELMERFKRGDSSRNTDGSGLGLAIARDLTNLMQGTFDITIDGDLFKATVKLKRQA